MEQRRRPAPWRRKRSRARGARSASALGQVDLVGDDDLRARGQLRRVARPAPSSITRRSSRGRGPVCGVEVHQVHQHPGALDVAQELVAEPRAFRGALDQPGMSAITKRPVLVRARRRGRGQRGERIVGHLRAGPRDAGDERGLAGVGEAEQPDVGEQLQLEERAVAPRPARPPRREARRLVRGRWRSACCRGRRAALGDHHALPGRRPGRRAARRCRGRCTSVPTGTRRTRSSPRGAVAVAALPCSPRRAW